MYMKNNKYTGKLYLKVGIMVVEVIFVRINQQLSCCISLLLLRSQHFYFSAPVLLLTCVETIEEPESQQPSQSTLNSARLSAQHGW